MAGGVAARAAGVRPLMVVMVWVAVGGAAIPVRAAAAREAVAEEARAGWAVVVRVAEVATG